MYFSKTKFLEVDDDVTFNISVSDSGCAKYISYCRNELQTYADQDFYSMFSEHKSPASEDNQASSNNDDIDSQASSHNDHTYSLPSSYADSSQCRDNADIIIID